MANLVTFTVDGTQRPGALKEDRVLELGGTGDLMPIIEGGPDAMAAAAAKIAAWDGPDHALEAVTLNAPVARPNKIIGIGLNYIDHCREAGLDVPNFPVIFTKYSTTVSGPYDDVVWQTDVCQDIDYEVELGVVLRALVRVAQRLVRHLQRLELLSGLRLLAANQRTRGSCNDGGVSSCACSTHLSRC